MRYVNQATGDELTENEVLDDVHASIAELEKQLQRARTFSARVSIGRPELGDSYLSFAGVIAHGYDRTGPVIVEAEE